MRHFHSIANDNSIIQGNMVDLSICENIDNHTFIKSCENDFNAVDEIICSPLKRTIETGNLISLKYNLKLTSNKLLIEVDCGTISAMEHKYLKKYNLGYYKIWNQRRKIDDIFDAEKCVATQARVLLFLFEYYEKNYNDKLIITHAIIMRTIVNIFYNLPFSSPVDISHNNYYILYNPWERIEHQTIIKTSSKCIVKVNTNENRFIIKRTHYDNNTVNSISGYFFQEYLAIKFRNTPELYYYDFFYDNKKIFIQKIEEYISGNSLSYHELNNYQKANLLGLFQDIISIDIKDIRRLPNSLSLYLESLQNVINTSEFRNTVFTNYIDFKKIDQRILNPTNIVYMDPHKDNLIFQKNKPFLIDFDNIVLASIEFQIGCLLSCYILFEISDFTCLDKEIIEFIRKHSNNDAELIIKSMMIRSAIGILYYYLNNKQLSIGQNEIVNKYKKVFFEGEKLLNDKDRLSKFLF